MGIVTAFTSTCAAPQVIRDLNSGGIRVEPHWIVNISPWFDLAIGVALTVIAILGLSHRVPMEINTYYVLVGLGSGAMGFSVLTLLITAKFAYFPDAFLFNSELQQEQYSSGRLGIRRV